MSICFPLEKKALTDPPAGFTRLMMQTSRETDLVASASERQSSLILLTLLIRPVFLTTRLDLGQP